MFLIFLLSAIFLNNDVITYIIYIQAPQAAGKSSGKSSGKRTFDGEYKRGKTVSLFIIHVREREREQ